MVQVDPLSPLTWNQVTRDCCVGGHQTAQIKNNSHFLDYICCVSEYSS